MTLRIEKGRSYIGESVIRPQTTRLLAGRGVFTDDVTLPRMLHVAFVRSPHAHARIAAIDSTGARALRGVVAAVMGEDMAPVCSGWVGTLAHFQGMKSAMQRPLAIGKASWQGEPVAAVVAESRAIAEDGVSRVRVEWEPLAAVTDPETALDPSTPVIHPELGDNLAFRLELASGDADRAFGEADTVLSETFHHGSPHRRHARGAGHPRRLRPVGRCGAGALSRQARAEKSPPKFWLDSAP